jgi:hypothetical protein
MTTDAELAFNEDVIRGIKTLQRDIDYRAPRFRQMVANYGGLGAARRLLDDPAATHEGFERLYLTNRLDMTIELLALLPWYQELFTHQQRDKARWRLQEHGMDVEARLGEAATHAPAWAREPNASVSLTSQDRERLVDFLLKTICAPCRRDGAAPDHPGCIEAEALVELLGGVNR